VLQGERVAAVQRRAAPADHDIEHVLGRREQRRDRHQIACEATFAGFAHQHAAVGEPHGVVTELLGGAIAQLRPQLPADPVAGILELGARDRKPVEQPAQIEQPTLLGRGEVRERAAGDFRHGRSGRQASIPGGVQRS